MDKKTPTEEEGAHWQTKMAGGVPAEQSLFCSQRKVSYYKQPADLFFSSHSLFLCFYFKTSVSTDTCSTCDESIGEIKNYGSVEEHIRSNETEGEIIKLTFSHKKAEAFYSVQLFKKIAKMKQKVGDELRLSALVMVEIK